VTFCTSLEFYLVTAKHGSALVETKPFDQRVVSSNLALAAS